jgi:hypothetical protein
VNDEVRALLQSERAFVFVTELGDVHSWSPPSGPRKLGNFGGRTSAGAALMQRDRLTAVVDQTRLVDFDLSTATRRVRADASSSLLLQGVPAITSRETRTLSGDGLLIGHDLAGSETLRVALDAQRSPRRSRCPTRYWAW